MEQYGNRTQFYSRSDHMYHYKSELPKTLQPFVNYMFSSGVYSGDDFKSFNTKYKNAIKKLIAIARTIANTVFIVSSTPHRVFLSLLRAPYRGWL